ncbi:MAG: hypothetical protein CGU28_01185 [Candidatus Dactylopiibacterium carminicum]|nr:MAG: hypothetical protein CGU28_01185 [Candidatus Dactylopiibacterium carminicum]
MASGTSMRRERCVPPTMRTLLTFADCFCRGHAFWHVRAATFAFCHETIAFEVENSRFGQWSAQYMNRRDFLGASLAAGFLQGMPAMAHAQDRSGRPIVVGQSVDLSGAMQNIGREYFSGAKIAFDQANEAGGVGGRPIRFLQRDDGGDPARTVTNTKAFLDDGAELLFGFCSEACVEAAVGSEFFRRSDVDLFAPLTGIEHPASAGRITYLHPSLVEEMRQMLQRLGNLSLTRLGIVHTETPSMQAAYRAIQSELATQRLERPKSYTLRENAANSAEVIQALARDGIQAVIVMADAFSAGLLLKPLRQRDPAMFACLGSMVDLPTAQQLIGPDLSMGILVARAVPDPTNTLIPVVANFRRLLGRYLDEAPTAMSLEGYVAAQTLLAVLRRADSPRRLAATARNRIGMVDLGGLKLNLGGTRAINQIQLSMLTRDGRLI